MSVWDGLKMQAHASGSGATVLQLGVQGVTCAPPPAAALGSSSQPLLTHSPCERAAESGQGRHSLSHLQDLDLLSQVYKLPTSDLIKIPLTLGRTATSEAFCVGETTLQAGQGLERAPLAHARRLPPIVDSTS